MNCSFCGIRIHPPSFHEIADQASHAVHSALKSARVIELCGYISTKLQAITEKVQRVFEGYKDLILLFCMSTVAAVLDPAPFLGAMAVGAGAHFIIETTHGMSGAPRSWFLEKAYEFFIAQTAFVAVNLGCKAVESVNVQFFTTTWRDGAISSMLGGLIAGASVAACVQRIYALAAGRLGREARILAL